MGGDGESGGVDGWGEPAEAGVRSVYVVVPAPPLQGCLRVGQRPEQGLVQELVPEPAVEAFEAFSTGLPGAM